MTASQLRQLRESRGLTRAELAEELGDCSASTVNKWERGMHAIPAWVRDKMLGHVKLDLPLEELQILLEVARVRRVDFSKLLAEAIRAYIADRRIEKKTPPPIEGSFSRVAESPGSYKGSGA